MAPVVDLSTRRRFNGVPRWLPAAAAVLLFGGVGAAVIAQGLGGGEDSFESADAVVDESAEAADTASDATSAGAEAADDGSDEEAMEDEEEAMEDEEEAMEDEEDALEEAETLVEEAEESEETEVAEDAASADQADEDDAARAEQDEFFFEDSVFVFDEVPTAEELAEVAADLDPSMLLDPADSICGVTLPETGTDSFGYFSVTVAGEPAELYVMVNDDESEVVEFLDALSCLSIAP